MVIGNTAQYGRGGGISNNLGGAMTLTSSTVSGNTAQYGGGGIYNVGIMTLTSSTVSGNTAQSVGGGIYNVGAMALTNSTIANNTASSSGGGIENDSSEPNKLTFSTIYGNKAAKGGGINLEKFIDDNGNQQNPSPIQIANSIVAGNSSSSSPDISGSFITGGYNLIQNRSGAIIDDPDHKGPTDLLGVTTTSLHIDSQLRDNDGSTQTLALLNGSPARDKIPLNACSVDGITIDQRGKQRPDNHESTCDIGAYESMV